MITVGFTGHRPQRLKDSKDVIYNKIKDKLIKQKPDQCISGMALGFDTWAAEACIELNIPFIAAVPFDGQDKVWGKTDKEKYQYLLDKAKEVIIVSEGGYAAWKLFKRNEYIVDNSDIIIAGFDGKKFGGTFQCLNYAKRQNKEIVLL